MISEVREENLKDSDKYTFPSKSLAEETSRDPYSRDMSPMVNAIVPEEKLVNTKCDSELKNQTNPGYGNQIKNVVNTSCDNGTENVVKLSTDNEMENLANARYDDEFKSIGQATKDCELGNHHQKENKSFTETVFSHHFSVQSHNSRDISGSDTLQEQNENPLSQVSISSCFDMLGEEFNNVIDNQMHNNCTESGKNKVNVLPKENEVGVPEVNNAGNSNMKSGQHGIYKCLSDKECLDAMNCEEDVSGGTSSKSPAPVSEGTCSKMGTPLSEDTLCEEPRSETGDACKSLSYNMTEGSCSKVPISSLNMEDDSMIEILNNLDDDDPGNTTDALLATCQEDYTKLKNDVTCDNTNGNVGLADQMTVSNTMKDISEVANAGLSREAQEAGPSESVDWSRGQGLKGSAGESVQVTLKSCFNCYSVVFTYRTETKFLELAMSLLDFSPRIPLGTFSILLCNARDIVIV